MKSYLCLGSNEGDAELNLSRALHAIDNRVGTISGSSSVYYTSAWGKEDQRAFLNRVIKVETQLGPQELLAAILDLERDLGRLRSERWGPRVIDIDILFYEDIVFNSPDLTIPHPLLHERKFVLVPLTELEPDLVHPVFEMPIKSLLSDLKDELLVKKLS